MIEVAVAVVAAILFVGFNINAQLRQNAALLRAIIDQQAATISTLKSIDAGIALARDRGYPDHSWRTDVLKDYSRSPEAPSRTREPALQGSGLHAQ